jgi:hypothetical protein
MTPEMEEKLQQFDADFDQQTFDRRVMGEEKYGPYTWLNVDTLQHAIDEVLDLGNYARFTYIKLRLLQEQLVELTEKGIIANALPGKEQLGKNQLGKDAIFNPMKPSQ